MISYLRRAGGKMKKPAVFLDRDGTINHNRPGTYLTHPRDLKFYADAFGALRILADLGYLLIVVSNQSGVGRGYMTLARSKAINMKLVSGLRARGIALDGVYFCPHKPEDNCRCRKPGRGLADEALRHHAIDLRRSLVIGDKLSDMKLADALGVRAIFLKSGEGRGQLKKHPGELKGRVVKAGLLAAARWIAKSQKDRPVKTGRK